MPTSERERFEAWALAECLSLHRYDSGPYSHDRTYSAWLAWQAALSAQPSPGGQGTGVSISDSDRAVLQRLQDALPFAGINGWGKGVEVLERLLRDSLAARQPVCATLKDSLTVGGGQSVGAVPQGCDACGRSGIRQNDEGRNIFCPDCNLGRACEGLGPRQPVASPPARAVDLGMPIAMIDHALGHLSTALDDLESSPDRRPGGMVAEAMACLRQALTGVQS